MRRITRKDLRGLYEPAPQSLYDGVHEALAGLPEGKGKRKVKKKISTGFILAAVLLALSAAGFAATRLNLFSRMGRYANPIKPLEGAETLVVENLASTENEWVTVTVEEAAYDGQGAMVLARLTVKNPEKYALLTDSGDPEELKDYDFEYVPVEVGEVQSMSDGHFEIRNDAGGQALLVDGAEVDIPESEAEAQEMGYPVYRADGRLYWAEEKEPHILGRKDGREAIGYVLNLDTMSAKNDGVAYSEADDPFEPITADDELQQDGSVLCWFDCFAAQPLTGNVRMRIRPCLVVKGEFIEMEPLEFTLRPAGEEHTLKLIPEAGDGLSGGVQVHSIEIHQTRVRGYLTVDFDYTYGFKGKWVDFALCDAEGSEICGGQAAENGLEHSDQGFSRYHMELQAFSEVPDTLILVAYDETGELGRLTCRVEED